MQRLLCVDNDTEITELYQIYGERAGFETKVCTSGADALTYMAEVDLIDAIILDLAMPTIDGLTAAQEIRRNEGLVNKKPSKIFFLSAHNIDDTIRRIAEETGVLKIYQKPFELDILMEEIKEFLHEDAAASESAG
jgi:CheY-like chemotaxis protein